MVLAFVSVVLERGFMPWPEAVGPQRAGNDVQRRCQGSQSGRRGVVWSA